MTDDSSKLVKAHKEKVVGKLEHAAGKILGSEELKQEGLARQLQGERKLEKAREGIEVMSLHEKKKKKKGKKHKKHMKKEEIRYEGEERGRTTVVSDVVTTKGAPIKGETVVYEHVHPVTVVEDTSIQREEKPKKKEVHVVQHIEPIKVTEVHRHIEPVEVVHKKEVVHPKEEVYVHEHVHPVEVTEIHEHVRPEVHSLERQDIYPDVVVKEKHAEIPGTEAVREEIHRDVDVKIKDLDVDIKTGGMREKHILVEEGKIESEKKKKGKKKKHHHSDIGTGKATKTSDTVPKV